MNNLQTLDLDISENYGNWSIPDNIDLHSEISIRVPEHEPVSWNADYLRYRIVFPIDGGGVSEWTTSETPRLILDVANPPS